MARRRFRNNARHEPATERSFQEYIFSTPALQTSRTELMRLVRGGEDTYLELKVKLSNPERIAQEIVALANTGGGIIVFGVNDQLRVEGLDEPEQVQDELKRICREEVTPSIFPYLDGIAFDNGRRILALEVNGRRRPYRTKDGRFYVRIGAEKREATREELSELMDESRPLGWENIPASGATVEDIDEAVLWSFLREYSGDALDTGLATAGYPTGEVLKRDLLLATGQMGEFFPTLAAIMLFGRNDRVNELIPRAAIRATRYGGDTIQAPVIEDVKLTGNLLTLFDGGMRFIRRYCELWDERPRVFPGVEEGETPVAARANYQMDSVKEALANCLVHRDLALREPVTRLLIFDNSIELINPRRTIGFAPPALRAIRFGVRQQLNPQLASIFHQPAYGVDLPATGLPMLLKKSRAFSGRRTEIYAVNDEFRLRMYGT
jgi:predicted HTH transcriptional regulator